MHKLITVACLGLPVAAWAQEPVFNYDPLLVATVQPLDTESEVPAIGVQGQLHDLMARHNTMVTMADVPRFETHGYDANTYMLDCPAGEYTGCALIVGQRGEAEWVIGGTLRAVPDEFEPGKVAFVLDLHFIDVRGSREVLAFGLVLDGTRDTEVLDGAATVFTRIVEGAFEEIDVRGELDDPAADAARAQAEATLVAESLAQLERQLGGVVVDIERTSYEDEKITRRDLLEYEEREDAAPWDQVGMGPGEFRRYRNSGKSLKLWRRESGGRFGQLLLRLGAGVGSGPFSQVYDGRVLLDSTTLQPVQTSQYLEAVMSTNSMAMFEAGFGVAPWLEIGFVGAVRAAQLQLFTDEDVEGQVSVQGQPSKQALSTTQIGGAIGFVPFVHAPARPTITAGIMQWGGKGVPASSRFNALQAPSLVLLNVGPGVEFSAGQYANIFARVLGEIPIAGSPLLTDDVGTPGLLENPPVPSDSAGVGFTVQAGVQVRLGPLWRVDDSMTPTLYEEEDL